MSSESHRLAVIGRGRGNRVGSSLSAQGEGPSSDGVGRGRAVGHLPPGSLASPGRGRGRGRGRGVEHKTLLPPTSKTSSLPSSIDPKAAVGCFRSQRGLLLNLLRHCLPTLSQSLLAECLIPRDVYEKANNQFLGTSERTGALLDCVEARIECLPSDFLKVVSILESEPFLRSLADEMVQHYRTFSSVATIDCPPTVSSAMSQYSRYLKTVYNSSPISLDDKWPPTPSKEYIKLEVVRGGSCRDEYIGHVLRRNMSHDHDSQDEIKKGEISMEEILEPGKNLVLIEGAPGMGKSTLAWELCRKWEEFSSMKQYKLVVLFRLREKRVQAISSVADLFGSYEGEDKGSLVTEVVKTHGKDILFVLDGFDELPQVLQRTSFLLSLIKKATLPDCTIVITSRPSASAELLRSVRPLIQKRVQILGFSQESVEAYATSVFSSDPKTLENFLSYISASKNPAINSLMYVPLNAAIIVEIYRNRKSDSLMPHTLTELYTQLCLTVLNRSLQSSNLLDSAVSSLSDLPPDLKKHFLKLTEVAFEGMERQEVIFHTLPSDLIHFGFLDAETAMYGGFQVSYNFLHLTLQEFFAAYHISQSSSDDLEYFFDELGEDEQWNIVWRFVAGLTKFDFVTTYAHRSLRFNKGWLEVNGFFIQCMYEAQIQIEYGDMCKILCTFKNYEDLSVPLNTFALGYCCSNIKNSEWKVIFNSSLSDSLLVGYKEEFYDKSPHNINPFFQSLTDGADVIQELCLNECIVDLAYLKKVSPLQRLTLLEIDSELHSSDMVHLSDVLRIPLFPSLKKLLLNGAVIQFDATFKVLRALLGTNVTELRFSSVAYNCSIDDKFCSALKCLIDPQTGNLEYLSIPCSNSEAMSLVSAPSSLRELVMSNIESMASFNPNSTLTKVTLQTSLSNGNSSLNCEALTTLLQSNRTLQELHLTNELGPEHLRAILDALDDNTTLQHLHLYAKKSHHPAVLDPRVTISENPCPYFFLF